MDSSSPSKDKDKNKDKDKGKPKQPATGRRAKLTPDRHTKIVQSIKVHAFHSHAAQYAGISPKTLQRWLERGAKESKGAYRELYDAVVEAEGVAAVASLGRINEAAARGDWKAAAWLLQHRFRAQYGNDPDHHQDGLVAGEAIEPLALPSAGGSNNTKGQGQGQIITTTQAQVVIYIPHNGREPLP